MKIGICDDDTAYMRYIEDYLNNHLSGMNNYTIEQLSPDELALTINEKTFPYDILITDIDMGRFNGIDFVKQINQINLSCIIIYLSGYLNYATEVYDTCHIYYVLKQELETRLPIALDKAIQLFQKTMNQNIVIQYQGVTYIIPTGKILYMETFGRYLIIHQTDCQSKCISSFKEMKNKLPDTFIKCHKSYMLNLEHIRSVSRLECIMIDNSSVPIGPTYAKRFQAAYMKFISGSLS